MMKYSALAAFLLIACTAACTPPEGYTEYKYLTKTGNRAPTPQGFTVCSGYGCRVTHAASFTPEEWEKIKKIFRKPAKTPAQEREQIRRAITRIERVIGVETGTSGDKGNTFDAPSGPDQMDCEDEAYNTSTYLQLMADAGWLRHHVPGKRVTRGHLIDRWPHITATVSETKTGARYTVDSWFFDNGIPPVILPVDVWEAGWSPASGYVAPAWDDTEKKPPKRKTHKKKSIAKKA